MADGNGVIEAKQVRRKDLGFLQKIYIPEIVKGLGLTLKTMFRPKFTRQYPEERWNPPSSFRGPHISTAYRALRCRRRCCADVRRNTEFGRGWGRCVGLRR